jgi:hypothetical protein
VKDKTVFGFLVGWGVFWFLVWLGVLIVSHKSDKEMNSLSVVMLFIVVFYLIAVFAGKIVS